MGRGRHGTVVIGIGNPDRGDDAAGRIVAHWLRSRVPRDVEIREETGEVTSLLACLEGVETACLVDACASGAPAGTVRRFDAAAAPLPDRAFRWSSHGLGLAEAVELARALGRMPPRCIVYAIEAASFELGAPVSPAVRAAVAEVGNRVREELRDAKLLWEKIKT